MVNQQPGPLDQIGLGLGLFNNDIPPTSQAAVRFHIISFESGRSLTVLVVTRVFTPVNE